LTTHADAIAQLRVTPDILETVFATIDEERATQPLDGPWGPKHLLAHLTLTDRMGAIGRIRRILAEDHPLLPEVDEDAALRDSGLLSNTASGLLEGFLAARHENVRWFESLSPEAYQRTGHHSAVGDLTAEQLLYHAAYHDTLHLQQLLAMLGGAFDTLRGPMRAY
jgi:hypothetical protein